MKLHRIISQNLRVLQAGAAQYGFRVKVTSGYRSSERQAEIYAESGTSKYPVAPPGRSQHQYGLAVDLVANPRSYQTWLGTWWQQLGLYWSPRDEVHFSAFGPIEWGRILDGLGGFKRTAWPVEPAPFVPTLQVSTLTAAQIAQALNLARMGDSSLASALLNNPAVSLSTQQAEALTGAIGGVAGGAPAGPTGGGMVPPSSPREFGGGVIAGSSTVERAGPVAAAGTVASIARENGGARRTGR